MSSVCGPSRGASGEWVGSGAIHVLLGVLLAVYPAVLATRAGLLRRTQGPAR